ncbi:MAG: hypothetical protein DMG06_29370 [Acidobacteria bacterium]|nr:MAG: hypothetical protein DMG06_29370 [Acidobacteriota bacterium]
MAEALLITILSSKERGRPSGACLAVLGGSKAMMPFKMRRQLLTQKTMRLLEVHEDPRSGWQLFKIHEVDPLYKIDRIVYRERSQSGLFKEISPEDYLHKVREPDLIKW